MIKIGEVKDLTFHGMKIRLSRLKDLKRKKIIDDFECECIERDDGLWDIQISIEFVSSDRVEFGDWYKSTFGHCPMSYNGKYTNPGISYAFKAWQGAKKRYSNERK